MDSKSRGFLAASVAGLVAAVGLMTSPAVQAAEGEEVPCYGINACKGTGDCGGKGQSCHGTNECKGAGWIKLKKETCLKIQGGRLTAEPAS